jgi:hypothetical protein
MRNRLLPDGSVHHPTLSSYYPKLLSLETYLQGLLEQSSWNRLRCSEESSQRLVFLQNTLIAIRFEDDVSILDKQMGTEMIMSQQEVGIV